MSDIIRRFAVDQSGATAIEYGLITALVAVAIIAVVGTLGVNLKQKIDAVAEAIDEAGR